MIYFYCESLFPIRKTPQMDIEKEPRFSTDSLLRSFMRNVPQPVVVVTTNYNDNYWGITMSSGTSASMDPPLFLLCIDKKTPSREPLLGRGAFVINLLNEDQIGLSDLFAGRLKAKDKFKNVKFHLTESGLPVFDDTLGYLECKIWKVHDGGDHDIILGKVVGGKVNTGSPVVYYDQSYGKLGHWEAAPSLYPPY